MINMDIARYPHISLRREHALRLIDVLIEKHGVTRDLVEAKRIILNFDEYYKIANRRSGGYVNVTRDPVEVIRGKAVIHRVRLLYSDDRLVELIIDKKTPIELITSALREIGFSEIIISPTE